MVFLTPLDALLLLAGLSLIIGSRFAVVDSIYLCDCELLECLSLLELLGYCRAS